LVEEVVGRHEAQARQRGIGVRSTISTEVPEVSVDPARVRQVLDNLMTNAIRHTPAGGTVVVAVTPVPHCTNGDAAMVQCRVTDAGPGFPEGQMNALFERFTRAGDSRGSGLGLSIVRDLVRAHGGTIEASNDPTTGGASINFTLPA
jgi:signal transduction histidine kinase